jgi:hypothetical protein
MSNFIEFEIYKEYIEPILSDEGFGFNPYCSGRVQVRKQLDGKDFENSENEISIEFNTNNYSIDVRLYIEILHKRETYDFSEYVSSKYKHLGSYDERFWKNFSKMYNERLRDIILEFECKNKRFKIEQI